MANQFERDGWFLSGKEMHAIRKREYHYNAWSSTLLDPYLQPFWRFIVSLIPKCVTPSILSACGLACNLVATGITVTFAPNLTEELPPWLCLFNALSIFLYQTFDGIDGKHCYRTQNSEVEEYADHAVDSLSIVLNSILLAAAMRLGNSSILLGLNLILALSAFFAAHLAAHRTHSLVFGKIDVSEAQWSMIAIHLVSAVGGPHVWKARVPATSFTLGEIVCLASATALVVGIAGNVSIALGMMETPLEARGIKIPRRKLSLSPILTYGIIMLGVLLCIHGGLIVSHTVPTMLIAGASLGKAATYMIFLKLVMRDGPIHDITMFAPLVFYVLSCGLGNESKFLSFTAWLQAIVLSANVVTFHACVLSDLKRARNINIFTRKEGQKAPYPKDEGFYVSGGNLDSVKDAWAKFSEDEKRVVATYGMPS